MLTPLHPASAFLPQHLSPHSSAPLAANPQIALSLLPQMLSCPRLLQGHHAESHRREASHTTCGMGNTPTGKARAGQDFHPEEMAWRDAQKSENYRHVENHQRAPNTFKEALFLGIWYYKEIADILDIHKSSKRVLCLRITDDLGSVEIVQINIYVRP